MAGLVQRHADRARARRSRWSTCLFFLDRKKPTVPVRYEPVADRKVTVALTAYNDEDSIADAVADFLAHPLVERVIVVSNNSRDATFARAEAAGAITFNELQPGYGRCVYRCLTRGRALRRHRIRRAVRRRPDLPRL